MGVASSATVTATSSEELTAPSMRGCGSCSAGCMDEVPNTGAELDPGRGDEEAVDQVDDPMEGGCVPWNGFVPRQPGDLLASSPAFPGNVLPSDQADERALGSERASGAWPTRITEVFRARLTIVFRLDSKTVASCPQHNIPPRPPRATAHIRCRCASCQPRVARRGGRRRLVCNRRRTRHCRAT